MNRDRRIVKGDIPIISAVTDKLAALGSDHALVMGISGIDGSGKGYVTARLDRRLRELGRNVAVISVDGWLNLPPIRFSDANSGLHFYENAFRLDQMFTDLISPLRYNRAVKCCVDHVTETASSFRKRSYDFERVDVILVEGIFIFKPEYRHHFDIKIWIDCSFETALKRAVSRSQEGLSPEDTIAAYQKIYFPAQRIHLQRDQPIEAADIVLPNDAGLD